MIGKSFQQLEKLKAKRAELESYCRLYAPPGTWDRWQQWQAEARKQRKAAKIAAEKAREERMETIATILGIGFALGFLVLAVWYLGVYLDKW